MRVRLPQPYDFQLSTERIRTYGPDLAYVWHDGVLHRVFDGIEARIGADEGGVRVEPGEARLRGRVLRLLGVSFDLAGFARCAARDPVMSRLARVLRGFRPLVVPDPFEQLVTSVTAQQISLHAARSIRNRLIERFSRRVGRAYPFPPREVIAAADPAQLVELGFSRRKAEYTVALAASDTNFEALGRLPDADVVARLGLLPGIGRWTAEWYLARHLGRPDVWPAGDLGLRKAVSRFYFDGRDVTELEARELGERFSPYRTLAAQYLLTGMRVVSS